MPESCLAYFQNYLLSAVKYHNGIGIASWNLPFLLSTVLHEYLKESLGHSVHSGHLPQRQFMSGNGAAPQALGDSRRNKPGYLVSSEHMKKKRGLTLTRKDGLEVRVCCFHFQDSCWGRVLPAANQVYAKRQSWALRPQIPGQWSGDVCIPLSVKLLWFSNSVVAQGPPNNAVS